MAVGRVSFMTSDCPARRQRRQSRPQRGDDPGQPLGWLRRSIEMWNGGGVLDARGVDEAEQIIRAVAAEEITPRFRRLAAADITEKGPGDLVTIADRGAEEALTKRLT